MGNNNIQICIGRQLGSGGHDIGRMLALDFGAKYYDRELLNLAAKESGFSERIFEQNDERKGFLSRCSTCRLRTSVEMSFIVRISLRKASSNFRAMP